MDRKSLLVIQVALVFVYLGAIASYKDFQAHFIFCDVGQGDATLIVKGKLQILIDTGPDTKVLECLDSKMPLFDRQIEMVIITHPEQDHLGGLVNVLESYQVKLLAIHRLDIALKAYQEALAVASTQGVRVESLKEDDHLKVGEIGLTVLWPPKRYQNRAEKPETEELNRLSVVLKIDYKSLSALLVGDIGEKEELALINLGVLMKVDILKVAHHGSKFSSSSPFLDRVSPSLAVVSVGKNNKFGHPTQDTLNRLDIVRARILRTDLLGTVDLVTDGKKVSLK